MYICHAPEALASEKHAYILREPDAHAVVRMYLEHGKVHLIPIAPKEDILLQNRPFTSDMILGHGNLLQIVECILVFEVYEQTVTIMMGLVPGYRTTPQKKLIKVTGGTTPTPSRPITPIAVSPLQPKVAGSQRPTAGTPPTPAVSPKTAGKRTEDQELSETEVFLSESSTTTMGVESGKSVSEKKVAFEISKGMLMAIAACVVVVVCVLAWLVLKKEHKTPPVSPRTFTESNMSGMTAMHETVGDNGKKSVTEEVKNTAVAVASDQSSVDVHAQSVEEKKIPTASKEDAHEPEKTMAASKTEADAKTEVKEEQSLAVVKEPPAKERTDTMVAVAGHKTEELLPKPVKEPVKKSEQTTGGIAVETKSLPQTDLQDDELTFAKKQYEKERKAFDEKLNNRLDNNQVYVKLWQVFREMRPADEDLKTAEDYRKGSQYYETLDGDLVLAVKITALKQENEKAEKDQTFDGMEKKIETQKQLMLQSAQKRKMEADLDVEGVDKDWEALSKTIEGAIGEISQLEDEIARIIKEGRNGRHLVLIRADARELNEIWGKRKVLLQNLEKDVAEIHSFEKLLKNGLEIRRQSEKLTAIYNTLNAGEKADFKMIDDAYQLLRKSYGELKAIDGLPADVWKLLQERMEVEENFYKEAKEVLNEK